MYEMLRYCEEFAESIYVRECVNGKWGSYKLSEIPFSLAIMHIKRWAGEGRQPARMLTLTD